MKTKSITSKPDLERSRQQHIGRALLQAQRAFNARALAKLSARGHDQLGMAHLTLLPHLETGGTRATMLAARADMTKQAAGQLLSDLETAGYVTRQLDPSDGRAMLVQFTARGEQFLADAQKIKLEIETEYAAALGHTELAALRQALETLIALEQPA